MIRVYRRVYKKKHRARVALEDAKWLSEYHKKHPERMRAAVDKYQAANRDKVNEQGRLWRKNNPEKFSACAKACYEKRGLRPEVGMQRRLSGRIRHGLVRGKNGQKTIDILGYSMDDLKHHLEALFVGGMSWDRFDEIHIDHIIPVSFFKFDSVDDVEFKMCWRLENLQPLWAADNIRKGNKILAMSA